MSTQQEIEQVEVSIEEAREAIRRKEMLVRLQANPDFNALIEKGFLEDQAIRQVMLKAHPAYIADEKHQAIFDGQIAAIGGLKQFLVSVYGQGTQAQEALSQHETTLAELHAEDAEAGGAAN